ncbi:ribonuclease P MRP protein subunit POP1 [Cryptosporidium andersoni]|uniref:Ribonuclease P MRP protein subunit POP1 n=1 Tax=Cryptosporidium andersoni TaxID=117008 RepID=A0A1J4MQR6_9CRYT|nr:ribonuclease P MRP protein subunit POP1 [Cryptosporidium andersoni]
MDQDYELNPLLSELSSLRTKDVSSLPQIISIPHLVQGREKEICKFLSFVQETHSIKRSFQRLPPNLRRRAMSYNPYRAPQRIRARLIYEMKKAPPKPSRRAKKDRRRIFTFSEKYKMRNRNHNLRLDIDRIPEIVSLANYNTTDNAKYSKHWDINTQINQYKWLESHMYFSKRFFMFEAFGYKLALCSTAKRRRKLYRQLFHNCIVHDMSYFHLYELRGEDKDIILLLSLCNINKALLECKKYRDGNFRGSGFAFQLNAEILRNMDTLNLEDISSVPFFDWERISPIEFVWQRSEDGSTMGCFWLWIHPLASMQLLDYLKECIEIFKINVYITFLEDLNRLEFLGPKSLQVLKKLLNVCLDKSKVWNSVDIDNIVDFPPDSILSLLIYLPLVFTKYRSVKYSKKSSGNHIEYSTKWPDQWTSYKDVKESVYDADYRKHLRNKFIELKYRSKYRGQVNSKCTLGTSNLISHETWRSRKRRNIRTLLGHILSRANSSGEKSSPNSKSNQLEEHKSRHITNLNHFRTPILLICHQGNHIGYDLIIPRGINSTILLRFLQSMSVPIIGIEERRFLSLELEMPYFPFDYIDTLSYSKTICTKYIKFDKVNSKYSNFNERIALASYLNTPPSKRINFLFNKIRYPFITDWETLAKGHASKNETNNESSITFRSNLSCMLESFQIDEPSTNIQRAPPIKWKIVVPRYGYRGATNEFRNIFQYITTSEVNLEKILNIMILIKVYSNRPVLKNSHLYLWIDGDEVFLKDNNELIEKPCKNYKLSRCQYPRDSYESIMFKQCCIKIKTLRSLVGVVTNGGYSMSKGKGFGIGYISLYSFMQSSESQKTTRLKFWMRYKGLHYIPVEIEQLKQNISHF